jgi:PPOX class probable FMN-dependent enzyme
MLSKEALMVVDNVEDLKALYGVPSKRSLQKQLTHLEQHSKQFIKLSRFVVLSSYDKHGNLDCSPRGGEPGFVEIINDRQLAIADSKGNNRLDTLINIVETGKIACLFTVAGVDEVLRVNGGAHVSVCSERLMEYADQRNPPKSIIVIDIEDVYLHCAKAIMRAKLWDTTLINDRDVLPSMGRMIADQVGDKSTVETQQQMVDRYKEQM